MAIKDVIGQDKAINILRGTLSRGRIASSYLFAGESGIGKKFTAVNLAKVLNCQGIQLSAISYQLIDCCDQCPSCRKIDSQTHPDFLMITPEKGEIRVNEIRAIDEALSFAPYGGKMKVVIVDDAETMNQSAANAFLKTLEEPPSQSMIILISSSPDRLPETIRSRCSRINFSSLSPERCEEVIKKQGSVSSGDSPKRGVRGQGLEKDNYLSTVARLSMGRPGLAISNDLIEEREWFIRLFKGMMAGGKEGWGDKEEIEKWFNIALTILRDLTVLKITGCGDMLINADLKGRITDMSKTLGIKDIIEGYFKLSFLKGYLGFNLNKAITWNYVATIMKNLRLKFNPDYS